MLCFLPPPPHLKNLPDSTPVNVDHIDSEWCWPWQQLTLISYWQVPHPVVSVPHDGFMEYNKWMNEWKKMTHKNFHEILVRELIIHSQEGNVTASGLSRGRPSPAASQLIRLEVKHSQHWPSKGKQRCCHVCSLQKETKTTYFCRKCDVGLCVVNCFEKWHTRVNLSC